MSVAMIRFEGVSMTYRSLIPPRPVHALQDCSLDFERGEVMGIAGPNGAGKTTLIGLALGFMRPSGGSVTVDGEMPRRYVERRGIAYLPELVAMPEWWRVSGALHRFATLSGLRAQDRAGRVEEAIDALGLEEHRGKRVQQLSKGNRQRLGIAQVLLSDSGVVILDEPTHGLDPIWTQNFRDIVEDLRRPERCIVIASHNLDELERIADRVAILDKGSVTRIVDLRNGEGPSDREVYLLILEEDHAALGEIFPDAVPHPEVRGYSAWEVMGSVAELNAGVARLLERGAVLRALHPRHSRLESVFREAVGGS